MKNSELLKISNNLNSISADELAGFPVRVTYAIYKNRDTVRMALSAYNATRDAIIRKYAPDGQLTKENEAFPEALAEISELAEMDEPVEIRMISISDLEPLNIAPQMMEKLIFMIGD